MTHIIGHKYIEISVISRKAQDMLEAAETTQQALDMLKEWGVHPHPSTLWTVWLCDDVYYCPRHQDSADTKAVEKADAIYTGPGLSGGYNRIIDAIPAAPAPVASPQPQGVPYDVLLKALAISRSDESATAYVKGDV